MKLNGVFVKEAKEGPRVSPANDWGVLGKQQKKKMLFSSSSFFMYRNSVFRTTSFSENPERKMGLLQKWRDGGW